MRRGAVEARRRPSQVWVRDLDHGNHGPAKKPSETPVTVTRRESVSNRKCACVLVEWPARSVLFSVYAPSRMRGDAGREWIAVEHGVAPVEVSVCYSTMGVIEPAGCTPLRTPLIY